MCHTDPDQASGHTRHSRPHFTRKRDTRFENLEIPINVVLPQRGTAEPFLRLHNLYSSPRCPRQAALPRPSRRVVSQHSYPLNRFSSVPLDPMERPTSQADLELDYNPPRVQLSDEMFVFQDGRWVNENCRLQSPYFSPTSSFHHKLHHKRLAKEYLLQDENKCLREENRALREENKTLRKENKILQVFWEEQKLSPGREDSRASSPLLRKDSAVQEAAKKDPALQGHRSQENSALRLLREENRALQQLLEQRKAYWALRVENQSLQVLREENRLLQEENRALHVLREEHRLFQEENKALWENNKLKLQQKLVIDTVTEVTARMEMLIEELYAFMPGKNKDPKKPPRV
ncbi:Spermatid-associated protein [Myotis davidii]|uniref:Protein chibby homolog 2 n=1 Tax=Myotis davidii TaxID=225400 RepID=L5M9Z9_MYODS|nr:Spermatid-associated protein [Myotis davidii]